MALYVCQCVANLSAERETPGGALLILSAALSFYKRKKGLFELVR